MSRLRRRTGTEYLACLLLPLLALFALLACGASSATAQQPEQKRAPRAATSIGVGGGRGTLARAGKGRHEHAAATRKAGWRGAAALPALLGGGGPGGDPDRTRFGASPADVPSLALLLARPARARAGLPPASPRPDSLPLSARLRAASAPFAPRDPTPAVFS